MNILIYVDYKSNEFNKDFQLSNRLLADNSVFLVTSDEQLKLAEKYYDLLLIGYSMDKIQINTSLRFYNINRNDTLDCVEEKIKEFLN